MLVFLDETFRKHVRTGVRLGALAGVAIPEDKFPTFQNDFYRICKPYRGTVLRDDHDVHGTDLLTNRTLKTVSSGGYTGHWSLAEDILNYARIQKFRVFGVVCFRSEFQTFDCAEPMKLDQTYQYLFERLDLYMRIQFPGRHAKLIFDDRGRQTNERNARAITNFFLRSTLGSSYDTIVKTPFYGIARTHNYGMQLADLITTVIGKRWEGDHRIKPLWSIVHKMLHIGEVGGRKQSSLKVMKNRL